MARRIALFYLVIASLWILGSDAALEWLAPGLGDVFYVSKVKGLFFVSFTSLLLYFFVKRENRKRQQLEAGYTELFENNPNPMWLSRELDGKIVAANHSACALYGYEEEQFKNLYTQEINAETPKLQGLYTEFVCHKHADGSEIWVKYLQSRIHMADEALVMHLVISADLAVKAEAERQEVQKRLNDLLESIDDFVFGIDLEGNFSFTNRAFEAYLGQTKIINRPALPLLDKSPASAGWAALLSTCENERRHVTEWFDAARHCWLRITAYQTEQGLGFYASNINERKQQEAVLQSQNQQLLDIAWTQSHHLRAPLANIQGLLHLLKMDRDHADAQALYIEKLEEAAQSLDQVIHAVVAKTTSIQPNL